MKQETLERNREETNATTDRHAFSRFKSSVCKYIMDISKNLLVAILAVGVAALLANRYSESEVVRLNDDLAYRYFDAMSRVIVADENGKPSIGVDMKRKRFYFKVLETIADDMAEVRRNRIFGIKKEVANELGSFQNLLILNYTNRMYFGSKSFSQVLKRFCANFVHIYTDAPDTCPADTCTNKQIALSNAKQICKENFSS